VERCNLTVSNGSSRKESKPRKRESVIDRIGEIERTGSADGRRASAD
jgi:hypothetical protein